MLAEVLSERKARKVTILPQRSSKAELVRWWSEMLSTNCANSTLGRSQRSSNGGSSEFLTCQTCPVELKATISRISGHQAVASQVVFIDGNPAKQHYRHYKIKNPTVTAGHSDDFAGLAEVIRRRFRKYAETTSEASDLQLQRVEIPTGQI